MVKTISGMAYKQIFNNNQDINLQTRSGINVRQDKVLRDEKMREQIQKGKGNALGENM